MVAIIFLQRKLTQTNAAVKSQWVQRPKAPLEAKYQDRIHALTDRGNDAASMTQRPPHAATAIWTTLRPRPKLAVQTIKLVHRPYPFQSFSFTLFLVGLPRQPS